MDVAVTELRAHLSSWLDRARDGDEIVVTEHGVPVARLMGIAAAPRLEQLLRDGVIGRASVASATVGCRSQPASTSTRRRRFGERQPAVAVAVVYFDASALVKLVVEETGNRERTLDPRRPDPLPPSLPGSRASVSVHCGTSCAWRSMGASGSVRSRPGARGGTPLARHGARRARIRPPALPPWPGTAGWPSLSEPPHCHASVLPAQSPPASRRISETCSSTSGMYRKLRNGSGRPRTDGDDDRGVGEDHRHHEAEEDGVQFGVVGPAAGPWPATSAICPTPAHSPPATASHA